MSILTLLDRPIAFNRTFVDLGVGITGALMLSQCVYWSTRTRDGSGWFYKTQAEWQRETGLTRREQETARKKLVGQGYLQEQKRGVPCKVYFCLNREALEADLMALAESRSFSMAESAKLDCTNAPNSGGGKRQTITESTAETTTEKTNMRTADAERAASSLPTCPHQELLALWAEQLPFARQPVPTLWAGTSRAQNMAARWRAGFGPSKPDGSPFYTTREEGLDWWRRFFGYIAGNEFLTAGHRWFDLPWVVKKTNFIKILERNYEDEAA